MPSTELQPPFDAYKGSDAFIFVSYSHKDAAAVFPDLKRLHELGYRVWFDEGIDPGNEWPEEVAAALAKTALFLVFISANSVASQNVRNEINFALNNRKQFFAIYLSDTELPAGLQLRMGDIQAVFKNRMSSERYWQKLQRSLPWSVCRSQSEGEPPIISVKESSPIAEKIVGVHEKLSLEVSSAEIARQPGAAFKQTEQKAFSKFATFLSIRWKLLLLGSGAILALAMVALELAKRHPSEPGANLTLDSFTTNSAKTTPTVQPINAASSDERLAQAMELIDELNFALSKQELDEINSEIKRYLVTAPGDDRKRVEAAFNEKWTVVEPRVEQFEFKQVSEHIKQLNSDASQGQLDTLAAEVAHYLAKAPTDNAKTIDAAFGLKRKTIQDAILESKIRRETMTARLATASRERPFTNSLGMQFVPVVCENKFRILFCIWETRARDVMYKNADSQSLTSDDLCPITSISPSSAEHFCQNLTLREISGGFIPSNAVYRLPTDKEWSYAVGIGARERGATPAENDRKIEGVYPWGITWPPPPTSGNYRNHEPDTNSLPVTFNDPFVGLAPVGSFSPNRFGIYDLGGNAAELCGTSYDPAKGGYVIRGGSYKNDAMFALLSSYRDWTYSDLNDPAIGFRVILDLSPRVSSEK